MKNCILFFFILGMGKMAFAQWITSGSDIYNSNAGNVGIGTNTFYSGSFSLQVGDGSTDTRGHFRSNNQYGLSVGNSSSGNFYFGASTDATPDGMFSNSSGSELMRITGSGNVGIGTTSPAALLHMVKGVSPTIKVESNTNSNAYLVLKGGGTGSVDYEVLSSGSGSYLNPGKFVIISSDAGEVFTINSGKVGIGTTSPGEKLSVNGNIRAKEIKVETSGWSDFVFEPDYKLPDLKETEQFIKENKHLPDIPSAGEVKEEGLNLGEMNAKLLQKIEELTLHLIEQNKEIKEQRTMIKDLQGIIQQKFKP